MLKLLKHTEFNDGSIVETTFDGLIGLDNKIKMADAKPIKPPYKEEVYNYYKIFSTTKNTTIKIDTRESAILCESSDTKNKFAMAKNRIDLDCKLENYRNSGIFAYVLKGPEIDYVPPLGYPGCKFKLSHLVNIKHRMQLKKKIFGYI